MLLAVSVSVRAQDAASGASPLSAAASATAGTTTGTTKGATPASSRAADRALRRRVLNALAKAKGLRAAGITVRATNGAVILEGGVPEEAQIEQAATVAKGVQGVTSVTNTLMLSTF
ncbi:BON domain-containing protein [Paraburkholderia acidisoli]|uniref:BON domain-containing protein n=2 Tax=Paraburkholderia acidisoli TaxID=2571748 RepID=A0A7Z2GK34_9BURK|nr:BON domain-containing protein [Paraburkholderia acidisoli]